MSDRPTPETDAASWVETNQANALTLASFSRQLERQRDEAREQIAKANSEGENDTQSELAAWELLKETRELARELRDALESCREDSVDLAGQYHWKRGAGDRNSRDMAELDLRIDIANRLLTKAKEVLP